MPLDPQRLARVRAHLLAAAALATAGCGTTQTVNEPVHINSPPDTTPTATTSAAAPSGSALPVTLPGRTINEPPQLGPTPTSTPGSAPGAAPTSTPNALPIPKQPVHINKPIDSKG